MSATVPAVRSFPAPLTLKDLGVTVTAGPDGSATIGLGWFGSKTLTAADLAELLVWGAALQKASAP
jgi:hypothetical protein